MKGNFINNLIYKTHQYIFKQLHFEKAIVCTLLLSINVNKYTQTQQ